MTPYNTNEEAIARLQLTYTLFAAKLANLGNGSGDLHVEISFSGQPEAVGIDRKTPNLRISTRFTHYSTFGTVHAEGYDLNECLEELVRRLSRDNQLKRLTGPSEEQL